MTISVIRRDMTSEENPECSHEFNFFLDRQLQTKLIEQDEILHAEELYSQYNLTNTESKVVNSKSIGKNEEIQGWVSEPKVILRKPEKEGVKQPPPPWRDFRNKQVSIQDSFVFKHYGDIRAYIEQYRREHTNGLGFKSHSALDRVQGDGPRRHGQSPSQIHVQQQNTCNCGAPPCASEVQKYLTAALQYTNRQPTSLAGYQSNSPSQGVQSANSHQPPNSPHTANGHVCTKHNHHHQAEKNSQAYKYKLSPDCQMMWSSRTESRNSERVEHPSPRMQSAKVYPSGKVPTKVSVPAAPPNGHVKRPPISVPKLRNTFLGVRAWRLPSRQNNPNKLVETVTPPSTTGVRTLDTLACVATDKQRQRPFTTTVSVRTLGHVLSDTRGRAILRPSTVSSTEFYEHPNNTRTHPCDTPKSDRIDLDIGASVSEDEEGDNSEESDAISISRLSTACLGADIRVKNENLEPSCTYHVFPNEMMLDNSVTVLNTRSLTWYPSISTPPQPRSRLKNTKRETPSPGMPEIAVAVAECYSPRLLRSRTEDRIDFPVIKKDVKGMLVASDINLGDQAKLESTQVATAVADELENDIETPRIMSLKESKTKLMKNLRKKYAGYINNKGKKPVHRPKGAPDCHSVKSLKSDKTGSIQSAKDGRNAHTADPTLHYWKYDEKGEIDRKSVTSRKSSRQREADEESMIKVAEYLLSDSNILATQGRQQEQQAGHKHGMSMAEGMWFDASGRAYVSLAARYDPLRK
ncbi:uncharacterized protein LOC134237320 isoform X3 [Saccostrea cucullata]|uniref:uncharacterized protein LOC134237320 isoform X3 n=1 Tax=Saccostrea cuccullata TaxID=36930 RepID=UPI002ED5080D